MLLPCLRVCHQVSTWNNLKTVLDKEKYIFKIENGSLLPVRADISPTTEQLPLDIHCSCNVGEIFASLVVVLRRASLEYSLQLCRRMGKWYQTE